MRQQGAGPVVLLPIFTFSGESLTRACCYFNRVVGLLIFFFFLKRSRDYLSSTRLSGPSTLSPGEDGAEDGRISTGPTIHLLRLPRVVCLGPEGLNGFSKAVPSTVKELCPS